MKLKVVLYSLLAAITLIACAGQPAWTGDPETARKLSLQMPEAQVRELLGSPTDTLDMDLPGVKSSAWVYKGSKEIRLVIRDGRLVLAELDNEKLFEAPVSEL